MFRGRLALRCLFLGWIVSCAATAANPADPSLAPREDGAHVAAFASENANASSMRSDGGAWLAAGGDLISIDGDGRTAVRIDFEGQGLGLPAHIAVDPYDGSVWVTTDTALLLHFAGDGALANGTTLPAPASALAVDLAQDAWIATGDTLMRLSRDGRVVATRTFGFAADEHVNTLRVDGLRDRLWVATSEGLYVGSAARAEGRFERTLRADVTALAVDMRGGKMLAVVDGTLIAFDDADVSSWLQEPPQPDERVLGASYDAADDVFVVQTSAAVLRIATSGRTVERDDRRSLRPTTPLRVDPTLALTRPPSGGAVTDPDAEVALRVGATCNGRPCELPAGYLDRMRVAAEIDGASLGDASTDASGRVVFPLRAPMHVGTNALAARVTDMFGHTAVLDRAHWTVLATSATSAAERVPRVDETGTKAANKPPTVAMVAPVNGAVFVSGGSILLTATAADADGTIARVEFYRGPTLIGTATSAPYQATWTGATVGTYSLTAKAYDDRKGSATSSAVSIVVVDNQPPAVTLVSPQPGAFSAVGSAVDVVATATDSDGTIASVEFLDGSTSIGIASSAPYRIAWTPTTAGLRTLRARATDDRGATAQSPVVDLLVGGAPAVVVTTPTACATLEGPLDVVLGADAATTSGKITSVDFLDNGSFVGTASAPPWRVVLVRAPPGTHSITAKATDEHGLTAISHPSTFTVRGPNQPPSVDLTAPVDGARFAFGSAVGLQASAGDPDGTVTAVEFRLDGIAGTLLARTTQTPYSAGWTNIAAGTYRIVAVAYDDKGASAVSAPVRVTIDTNAPPSVTLTAPLANARLVAGTSVAVTANASDGDGSVARVDFQANGASIGSSTAAPYAVTWMPASPGTYALTAKATDNAGASATSPAVTVTVTVNAPPTIALSVASPDGDLYAPATIVLTAEASDSDGAISGVDFYADSMPIGHASAPPYRIVWDGVAAGTHALTAKATDDSGGTATSSAVDVTVAAGPSIDIDPALAGATIDDDNVLIRGFVSAPLNAAVTVNGVVTHVDDVGRFNANEVPLVPGANTVTVQVTTQGGASTSASVVVNSSGTGPFVVHASPTEGLESLDVTFTIENPANTPFGQMLLDLDGDGSPNLILTPQQFSDGKLTVSATYPEGTWVAVLKAYDDQGRLIYSTSRSIVVRIPQILQNKLLAVYDGMLTRLRAGNVPGALTALTGSAYERYRGILTDLQPSLAEIVDQLGEVQEVTFGDDVAEMTIVRSTPDGPQAFLIYMLRSEDGIWRIDAM